MKGSPLPLHDLMQAWLRGGRLIVLVGDLSLSASLDCQLPRHKQGERTRTGVLMIPVQ